MVDASRLSFNKTYTNLHSHQYLLPHQNGHYYHYLNFCQFGKLFSCWLFWLPERSTTLCLLSITFLLPWSDFLYFLLIFLLELFLLLFVWFVDLLRVMGISPLICYVPCKYFLPFFCFYFHFVMMKLATWIFKYNQLCRSFFYRF